MAEGGRRRRPPTESAITGASWEGRGSDLSGLDPREIELRGAIVTYEEAILIAAALGLDVRAE